MKQKMKFIYRIRSTVVTINATLYLTNLKVKKGVITTLAMECSVIINSFIDNKTLHMPSSSTGEQRHKLRQACQTQSVQVLIFTYHIPQTLQIKNPAFQFVDDGSLILYTMLLYVYYCIYYYFLAKITNCYLIFFSFNFF